MEFTRLSNGTQVYQEDINVDTDLRAVFDASWFKLIKQPKDCIDEILDEISTCRECFIDVYNTEEEFDALDLKRQMISIAAMKAMLLHRALNDDYQRCNGISMFTLWIVARIKKDFDTAHYIENELREVRNRTV